MIGLYGDGTSAVVQNILKLDIAAKPEAQEKSPGVFNTSGRIHQSEKVEETTGAIH